ncbi:helix-hairpin-helix domain-containing protein [Saprospiraceae bacterium]|jgi:competence protein ComEA|nr:helix-hairpin-helix domain-containing protein [Bacteroidota bacterium]MDB4728142.1 helix-hairpin-helix domain-containing protein [Saprospiraceae bacterium]
MKNQFKKWFRPTRAEYFSALILASICFFSFCAPFLFSIVLEKKPKIDFTNFEKEIDYFLNRKQSKEPKLLANKSKSRFVSNTTPKEISLFFFNPNIATKEDFLRLGLSKKVSQTIVNYRKKGGKFIETDDFSRIYGLQTEDFQRLKPFIELSDRPKAIQSQIADKQPFKTDKDSLFSYRKTLVTNHRATNLVYIDINKATPEEWQKLNGIGEYYSKRLVKFREALGGFSSIEQIAETYNFPDSTFQKIKPFLKLTSALKKISINSIAAAELKSHPYLKWKHANGIVNYREKHGAFSSMDDLRQIGGALTEDLLDKIEPYLEFE